MAHITGIITIVQESRFRLSPGDGRSILFTLAGDATLEPQDLPDLADGPRVTIHYSEGRGRLAMTAHRVDEVVA